MCNRRRLAVAAILAFSLLLFPSLSFAAAGFGSWRPAAESGPLEVLLDWLDRGWSLFTGGEPMAVRRWEEAGCGIDPNGAPVCTDPLPANTPTAQPEDGDSAE